MKEKEIKRGQKGKDKGRRKRGRSQRWRQMYTLGQLFVKL